MEIRFAKLNSFGCVLALGIALLSNAAHADDIFGPGQSKRVANRPNNNSTNSRVKAYESINEAAPAKTLGYSTRVQPNLTIAPRRLGLRISGYIHPAGGVLVRNVKNGPATRLRSRNGLIFRMEKGDVLERFNGRFLGSAHQYFEALQAASATPNYPVTLTVRDINTGHLQNFTTYLAPLN